MSCRDCQYFDTCSAPICPEDHASLGDCAWFPDEETCHRKDHRGTAWITRQRKIARVTGKDFSRGCFTYSMLAHDFTVYRGIKGLDPETEITAVRMEHWIAEHRRKRHPGAAGRLRRGDRCGPQNPSKPEVAIVSGPEPGGAPEAEK